MNKMRIPDVLHVGYQKRSDTYTGKLAYIIYEDEKGKKRKETSWNNWCNEDIPKNQLNNEPTEGFVLNRNGGGRGWSSWDSRREFIRVWDPRDFEFEISLANLLFILQECTSTKGKGIEGKFVYAWDGTELVLLPVGCKEYKESKEFTGLKSMKVTKKEMVKGALYLAKDTSKLMYLGRHLCKSDKNKYHHNWAYQQPTKNHHVFYDINECKYRFESGFTKLAKVIDTTCQDTFADQYTEFTESKYCHKGNEIRLVEADLENSKDGTFYVRIAEGVLRKLTLVSYAYYARYENFNSPTDKPVLIPECDLQTHITNNICSSSYTYNINITRQTFLKYFKDSTPLTVEIILNNGLTIGDIYHVKKR